MSVNGIRIYLLCLGLLLCQAPITRCLAQGIA